MPTRRLLLRGLALHAPLLPLALSACASRDEPEPLPSLVSGYRHLTPIRLNVAEIEIADPIAGAVRVFPGAPLPPEREMLRMAQDRLVAMGTEGTARFLPAAAELQREVLPGQGGVAGLFAGDPGERISCRLLCRLELASAEGRRVAFVEAEARRSRTEPDGASPAARRRAAEQVVRQAMEELNVEFEFQVRRSLRAWLVEGAAPAAAAGTEGVQREDLPRR